MLTVQEIAELPELGLAVAAGAEGLRNEVSWLHVSELADPTQFLEGGEFLLTTGLGVGEMATTQRAYVRRLAKHGLAGLGFGVGFGFPDVPAPVVEEANKLAFPVLAVPYEIPFVAITKAAVTHLASEQLEQMTRALEVHERLAAAVLEGRGLQALLAVVCNHLGCSLALVDESGRVAAERHARDPLGFDNTFAMVVRRDTPPTTLSGATEPARRWHAGFGYEFQTRPDGYPALQRVYGLSFADIRTMDLGLLYRALGDRQIDVAAGSVTDGLIEVMGLRVLADDRHAFPPYEAAPVARADALAQHAGLREALTALGGTISAVEMRRMNAAVDGEHRDLATVVHAWRERRGGAQAPP